MRINTILLTFAIAASVASANLVTNPGFEAGFAGWTVTGGCTGTNPSSLPCAGVDTNPGANTGSGAAILGAGGSPGNFLSQTIATAPGMYSIDFWLAVPSFGGSTTPNSFTVLFDGATVLSNTNMAASGYTHFTIAPAAASGTSTVLQFNTSNNPSYFFLDDVNVVATADAASVPEPASVVSLFIGAAGLCGLKMLRRRS